MANKRMFSLSITDTDTFLDMPTSAQALYFHLGMHGDDDGFVGSPNKILRSIGCDNADLNTLQERGYIIRFPNGILVIRDWRINNTLKNDRYRETVYLDEKAQLEVVSNGAYRLRAKMVPDRNRYGSGLVPQHNVTQQNREKGNLTPPPTISTFDFLEDSDEIPF